MNETEIHQDGSDEERTAEQQLLHKVEQTSGPLPPGFRYAGFWIRLLASALDTVILLLITYPLMYWLYGSEFRFNTDINYRLGSIMINYVMPVLATIIFWRYRSATPGKMMMGISIVDAKTFGKPPTLNLWIRYFGYIVSMIPLFLGYIWVAFDQRKQGFHDKLADTLVIIKPEAEEAQEEVKI